MPAIVSVPASVPPVGHLDGQRADAVGPSLMPAAAIASVTNDSRSGPTLPAHVAVQRTVHVHAVGDDLNGHPRILDQCDHGAGSR